MHFVWVLISDIFSRDVCRAVRVKVLVGDTINATPENLKRHWDSDI